MALWIPPSQRNPAFIGHCNICGSEYASRVAYEHHVALCASQHAQELADLNAEVRAFTSEPDPEWGDYCRALKAEGCDPEVQYARGRRSNIRRASES